MKKEIIFENKSLYRDSFRVTGFRFGSGKKTACIVGSIRGNEVQQLYACARLTAALKELEKKGRIREGKEILVIPSVNPYSMNVQKRFWPTDNTDINRMFPGYNLGETTQRIAAGVFEKIKDYKYGMQFASFYMPGEFMPHVRMMKTGFESVELAKEFGLPYVVVRSVRPYDTTTLNYNWQIWDTKAFSIYTTTTERIDEASAKQAVRSILNFLDKEKVIRYKSHDGYISSVVEDTKMKSVRVKGSGFFQCLTRVGEDVAKGQVIARVLDPYDASVKEEVKAPVDSVVFFAHDDPLTYANTAVFKLIPNKK
ncbi:MAG: M14 family metallopeptidase [Lachnospiraceae bacterium]|nr:M14 family metallopeptidase [Lachnospiraceae bacterium]